MTQGWLAYLRGDLREALNVSLAALHGDHLPQDSRCMLSNNLGLIYRGLGATDRALDYFLKARNDSRALMLPITEGGALINISLLHANQKDYLAALDAAQEAVALIAPIFHPFAQLAARSALVDALTGLGRYAEAEVACHELLVYRNATVTCAVLAYQLQGRIYRLQGNYTAAKRALNLGLKKALSGKLGEQQLQIQRERAELFESMGQLSAAARLLESTLITAEEIGLKTQRIALLEIAARVAEKRKHYRSAYAYLHQARESEKEQQTQTTENQRIQFGVELELERAKRETARERAKNIRLKEEASRDGMTGLYNHAAFQKLLRQKLDECTGLGLILLDVDDFKHYNDTHGHVAGDVLLKDLARLMQAQLRPEDILSRYGGEEFAILLPELDPKGAERIAGRLQAAIAAHSFGRTKITASLGVACTPPTAPEPGALVEAADQALYRAKRTGKNQVIVSAF
jgi:diguanylate cyclase (GGDEF)-like protein